MPGCGVVRRDQGVDDGRTADAFPAASADGRRVLGAEIGWLQLHLAAEGKAPKTIRLYTEAVAWFAARLLDGGKVGNGPGPCATSAGGLT